MENVWAIASIMLSVVLIMATGLAGSWLVKKLFPNRTQVLNDGYIIVSDGRKAVHVSSRSDLDIYISYAFKNNLDYRVYRIANGMLFEFTI